MEQSLRGKNQLNPLSRFTRSPTCDRHGRTHGHSTYSASISSRGKNLNGVYVLLIAAPASTAQLRHVITGVAVVTASSNQLQLYFGCTAQTPIIGGAGLVRMRTPLSDNDNFRFRSGKVVPVRTAATESPLFAGSMFAAQQRAWGVEVAAWSDSAAAESSPPLVLPVVLCALSIPYHVTLSY